MFIEHELTASLYDESGQIAIDDERIRPDSYRGLFLKLTALTEDGEKIGLFLPLDNWLTVGEVEYLVTPQHPAVVVVEGGIRIYDPDRVVLELLDDLETTDPIRLAVLVCCF